MREQRRHPRIRFGQPPEVRLGFGGMSGRGVIENLSPGGVMIRTELPLRIGGQFGCEFALCGLSLVDVPVTVVSRVGDLYGGRFASGPLTRILVGDAIDETLASGRASVLAVHELGGRKVLRVAGGLNGSLAGDFMHALTRGSIDAIDVREVTAVDEAGLALCVQATGRYGIGFSGQSACFAQAWEKVLALPKARLDAMQ